MFKKLHLKLTMTNTLILIIFLFSFSFSIVSISSFALDNTTERALQKKASQIINVSKSANSFQYVYILREKRSETENILRDMVDMDYMIWDNDRDLSSFSILEDNLIQELYNQSKNIYGKRSPKFNIFKVNGKSYRLYSQYYMLSDGRGGVVQVFQSREIDNYLLRQLFFVIICIGLVSIGILIFISSYLAKKSLEPVRLAYERQKEFVSDASHELRTPLTIMKTNLELLSMKEDETIKENEKWFNNITSETDTMAKLVQNLLTLAQVDNNQMVIKAVYLNLSQLTQRVCDKLSIVAASKGIDLSSVISDNVMVKGDEGRLEQLIVILIDNAIKYTPQGGKIQINLMTTAEKAYLSVKDTGIGMKKEDIDKIFERFYRVDKVRSREQGGVGLGLNIAEMIVKEHKGKIDVVSSLGEGSEFIVELNIKK